MKRSIILVSAMALLCGSAGWAFGQGSPEPMARKFLDLASRADPKALEMLDETDLARSQPDFAAYARSKWGAPPGYASVAYPELLLETRRGDWALYVFRRELVAAAGGVPEKALYGSKIENYFADDQREQAKKVIFWKENTFETVVPVIVHRANEDKPWKVFGDSRPEAPLASFHAVLMRKYGCNLLRWTEGEAGRPLRGWIAGESPEAGTDDGERDTRCMKPETGGPCGVGESGCLDKNGKACTGHRGEAEADEGSPPKGGRGKKH